MPARGKGPMIGLVIVAHGGLAREFLAALEHVVGPQPRCSSVAVGAEDDGILCRDRVRAAIMQVDTGAGVVVVTDMVGGTPANLAVQAALSLQGSAEGHAGTGVQVAVIHGANLPLLVKLAKLRSARLTEAVARAVDSGRKYVTSTMGLVPSDRQNAAAS